MRVKIIEDPKISKSEKQLSEKQVFLRQYDNFVRLAEVDAETGIEYSLLEILDDGCGGFYLYICSEGNRRFSSIKKSNL